MSADLLREAAAKMRELAEAATPSPWSADARMVVSNPGPNARYVADCYDVDPRRPDADDRHIASWHPAVALAVADWLDACAQFLEDEPDYTHDGEDYALTVARAYLGEAS